jgi:lipoic acid synthetase
MDQTTHQTHLRKPDWLKIKLPNAREYAQMRMLLGPRKIHTICESGNCPNVGECWGSGTATFMIMGDICTRSCKFCNVATGKPLALNPGEPEMIAEAVSQMGLKHVVITSVDRDDLPDGGAAHWALTIKKVKDFNPEVKMETLIPDFRGDHRNLKVLIDTRPEVISHNLETVERLTPEIRSVASYHRSLEVIKWISESGIDAKSGIMLGLGETEEEIFRTMDDLLVQGCRIFTMGQYLQPTQHHFPVSEYVHPDKFSRYKEIAIEKGFRFVESGPLVRSSYHAEKQILQG